MTESDSAKARIRDLFLQLYGDHEAAATALDDLYTAIDRNIAARPDRLRDRDGAARRDWFLAGEHVGYSCYADRFAGTLDGVRRRIPHLKRLGVTYLHLLPIFETAGPENDGGFAVSDYRAVRPTLGTMADLRALAEALHDHGIALCLDFIANHTASAHPWAHRAVQGIAPYDRYYHFFDSYEDVTAAERALDDVFPSSAPGNFVYIPDRSAWVWSTFQNYQWDLNYANPQVTVDMVDTLLFLTNQGVDALRIDSAPFLWKAVGSRSRDRDETHLLIQLFRAVTDFAAPSVALLAEAIVAPRALVRYLGAGDPPVRECHMAYQGVLMPMLWLALVERDARPLQRTLDQRLDAPVGTTWLQYVRSHDNIEWDVLSDELLAQAGVDPRRIARAVRFLHGEEKGSFADGRPFEAGLGDRLSTNGTTASLCGLSAGASEREAGEAIDRILLLYGILYALPGFPLLFGGDELGMLNDDAYASRPAEAADSRWLHRPFLDWTTLSDPHARPRLLEGLQRLALARRATGALTAFNALPLPRGVASSVLVLERHHGRRGRSTVIANLAPDRADWTTVSAGQLGLSGRAVELLNDAVIDGDVLGIEGYDVAWYRWQTDD